MKINNWHAYIREGMAYFPTVAQTNAGFFVDVEPVVAVEATDRIAIESAFKSVILRGNPSVPTPNPSTKQPSVVLEYAKVKTWKAFEKTAMIFSVVEAGGIYKLKPHKRRIDRGWEADAARVRILPDGTTLDEVARLATECVLEEAKK